MPDRTIITLTTFVLVCALWIIMHSTPTVEAANPANGTISPTGPNVVWQGPVTGGADANQDTCVEGTNCDTFKLTVTGTEEDWAGKVVNINITWVTPANVAVSLPESICGTSIFVPGARLTIRSCATRFIAASLIRLLNNQQRHWARMAAAKVEFAEFGDPAKATSWSKSQAIWNVGNARGWLSFGRQRDGGEGERSLSACS
ncbi:MAG TPA: hypothetical protein VFU83_05510 [Pyrinomonadaceae bacterium]|nr:hypothetical protein [Pyrinomonadaceae bacterium]